MRVTEVLARTWRDAHCGLVPSQLAFLPLSIRIMTTPLKVGSIGWTDLTVPDAVAVSDFYGKVAGWSAEPLSMGDYDDYVMKTPDGDTVGGICHKRKQNSAQPSVWMMYITVASLDASLAACTANGGRIVVEPRSGGGTARYAVIEDPAGASVALFDPGA